MQSNTKVFDFHWIGLAVVLALFLLRVVDHFEYTPDDTYIYLQYARNTIQHHEVAFNAGEPSYGVTSPLWLAVISVSGWCGIDLLEGAKRADVLIALLAIVSLYGAQRSLTGDKWIALMTAAVLSTHVWFLRWSGSGMETSLSALLSILMIQALMNRRYHIGAVCSALLLLTRPETSVLSCVVFLCSLFVNEPRESRGKLLLVFAVEVFLLASPWYFYAYATFGTVVPNTAIAKSVTGFSLENMLSTLVDIGKTLAVSDGFGILTITAFCAGYAFWKLRHKEGGERKQWKSFLIPILWIVIVPGVYIATSANVVSRYLILISPLIILLALALPFRILKPWLGERSSRVVISCIAGILLLSNVVVYEAQIHPQITMFSTSMRDCLVYIGTWLGENTREDDSVLAADVGAIGYFSERRICDAAGLVSPELLPFTRRGYSIERIMVEQVYADRCNARYVVRRSTIRNATHASFLRPVFTRAFYGLSLSSPDTLYYTVFRVVEGQP